MGSTREACCSERMNFKYIQPSPPERNQSVALISTPAMEVNQRLRGTAEEQSHPGKPRTGLSAGIFRPVGLHVCATSLEHSTIPAPAGVVFCAAQELAPSRSVQGIVRDSIIARDWSPDREYRSMLPTSEEKGVAPMQPYAAELIGLAAAAASLYAAN